MPSKFEGALNVNASPVSRKMSRCEYKHAGH
jgi:hypothetical protein